MSTIPGLSASNLYSYLSSINADSSINQPNYATLVQASQLSAITTLTSSGNNSSSPLTYNSAGLLGSLQPTTPTKVNTSSAQAAQNAYLEVEYAITQTLGSMMSDSSTNSANSDFSSLFGLAGTANINGLFGSTNNTLLPTGSSSSQAAQYAAINAQFALNQMLNSLTTSSSGV